MAELKKTTIEFENSLDDLVLRKTISKYEQTRKRVSRHIGKNNLSDKEIIECLYDEIEQYRGRIEQQNRIIDELHPRTIQSEEVTLDTTEDELVDKDVIEIISRTQYADGKPITTKMEYKYKENKEEENTCPPIIPELRPGY